MICCVQVYYTTAIITLYSNNNNGKTMNFGARTFIAFIEMLKQKYGY